MDPCLHYNCYAGTCTNDRGAARCICPTGRAGVHCQGNLNHPAQLNFILSFKKRTSASCIHVQIVVNAFRKVLVDAVSVLHHITAMIVENVLDSLQIRKTKIIT